jgi:hypothetical protein
MSSMHPSCFSNLSMRSAIIAKTALDFPPLMQSNEKQPKSIASHHSAQTCPPAFSGHLHDTTALTLLYSCSFTVASETLFSAIMDSSLLLFLVFVILMYPLVSSVPLLSLALHCNPPSADKPPLRCCDTITYDQYLRLFLHSIP